MGLLRAHGRWLRGPPLAWYWCCHWQGVGLPLFSNVHQSAWALELKISPSLQQRSSGTACSTSWACEAPRSGKRGPMRRHQGHAGPGLHIIRDPQKRGQRCPLSCYPCSMLFWKSFSLWGIALLLLSSWAFHWNWQFFVCFPIRTATVGSTVTPIIQWRMYLTALKTRVLESPTNNLQEGCFTQNSA